MEPFNDNLISLAYTYHSQKDYKNAAKCYYRALQKVYLPDNEYTRPVFILSNDSIPEYKAVLLQCGVGFQRKD